jgi:hypothetical protein
MKAGSRPRLGRFRLLGVAASIAIIMAELSLGLSIGLLAVGAYHWARWGEWSTLTLAEWLHSARFKLPRSSWVGIERTIEWMLGSPALFDGIGTLAFLAIVTFTVGRWLRLAQQNLSFWHFRRNMEICNLKKVDGKKFGEYKLADELAITRAYEKLDRNPSA